MKRYVFVFLLIFWSMGLGGCELLRLPFQLVSSVINMIPRLLMLSDASSQESCQDPKEILAKIKTYLQQTRYKENLPDGYTVLKSYIKDAPIYVTLIDFQKENASQKIEKFYTQFAPKGKIHYICINSSMLLEEKKFAELAKEIQQKGGKFFIESWTQ